MRHRLLAVIGYPGHLLNRAFAGVLERIGLGRVPAGLIIGLAIGALAAANASSTAAAYELRPEPIPATVSEIEDGRVDSGLWVVFDAVLVDGPHVTQVEVFSGPGSSTVERTYYLVADPADAERAVVVRARGLIPGFDTPGARTRMDGSITEDAFSMRALLRDWDPATRHPGISFGESRLIAFGFATPWQEPSYLGAALLGAAALVLAGGSLVRQPIVRIGGAGAGARGRTPIALVVHGELPTPRGPLRLAGTPAQLQWMSVEEAARVHWRYWGAALGEVRGVVESAVREHGSRGERLVLYGPTGSLIWPIERPFELAVEGGDAFMWFRRRPALTVKGEGAAVVLTFADPASRDAAAVEIVAADRGSPAG
ncbi:MAG: hypothetical protein ABIW50_09175 [Candidatus Limnocylindria bacterium]